MTKVGPYLSGSTQPILSRLHVAVYDFEYEGKLFLRERFIGRLYTYFSYLTRVVTPSSQNTNTNLFVAQLVEMPVTYK